ncbi:hypothetical protein [uncultured Bifidobacterium sp.]|nr:hypothetical protein [uncultured Bifidobacterium sp.]
MAYDLSEGVDVDADVWIGGGKKGAVPVLYGQQESAPFFGLGGVNYLL